MASIRVDQIATSANVLNLTGSRVTNVGSPSSDTDLVTKAYVDANSGGLSANNQFTQISGALSTTFASSNETALITPIDSAYGPYSNIGSAFQTTAAISANTLTLTKGTSATAFDHTVVGHKYMQGENIVYEFDIAQAIVANQFKIYLFARYNTSLTDFLYIEVKCTTTNELTLEAWIKAANIGTLVSSKTWTGLSLGTASRYRVQLIACKNFFMSRLFDNTSERCIGYVNANVLDQIPTPLRTGFNGIGWDPSAPFSQTSLAIKALSARQVEKMIQVACLGDSNTDHGYNNSVGLNLDYTGENWVQRLNYAYRANNIAFTNYGVSGRTAAQWVSSFTESAIVQGGAGVTVALWLVGINDFRSVTDPGNDAGRKALAVTVFNDIKLLVQRSIKFGYHPWVCTYPLTNDPVPGNNWTADELQQVTRHLNHLIRTGLEQADIIDLERSMATSTDTYDATLFHSDNLHFNAAGATRVATAVQTHVDAWMNVGLATSFASFQTLTIEQPIIYNKKLFSAPTATENNDGLRMVWYPTPGSVPYSTGIATSTLYHAVPGGTDFHAWYHGTSRTADMTSSTFQLAQTTESTSTTSGALTVAGGIGVAKNLYVAGLGRMTNTTDSSSTTTGSWTTAGGVGIAKDAWIGQALRFNANTLLNGTNLVVSDGTDSATIGYGRVLLSQTSSSIASNSNTLGTAGSINVAANGQVVINASSGGNLLFFGTTGNAGPAFTNRSVGSRVILRPNISGSSLDVALGVGGTTTNTAWISSSTGTDPVELYNGTSKNFSVTSDAITLFASGNTTGVAQVKSDLNASNATTASLSTLGGLGVSKDSVLEGALYGGIATQGNSAIYNPLAFAASLSRLPINGGNTVYLVVGGTGVYTLDSSITGTVTNLHDTNFRSNGITSSTVTVTHASTVYIEGPPTAGVGTTLTNAYALRVGAGQVKVETSTSSSSTTTGAMVVTGGVGVGGNLNVGGTFSAGTASGQSITFSSLVNTATVTAQNVSTITNGGFTELRFVAVITPTAATTTTSFQFTCPLKSGNFANHYDAVIAAQGYRRTSDTNVTGLLNISGNAVSGGTTALVQFTSNGSGSADHFIHVCARYS